MKRLKEEMRREVWVKSSDLDFLGEDPVHTQLINSRLGPPDSFDDQ